MSIILCQDNNPLSIENEPDVHVILSVDTRSKSSINDANSQEPFACHECTNCNDKSGVTTRICESDINMCYVNFIIEFSLSFFLLLLQTIHKRINKTNRILRRGCSTSKGQCTVPDDNQLNIFDSITCCTSHQCNQGVQFPPWFFLVILNLFLLMIHF